MQYRKGFMLIIVLVLALSACAPTREATMAPVMTEEAMLEKPAETMEAPMATEAMMEKASEEAMGSHPSTPEAMIEMPTEAMMDTPDWFNVQLSDVNSGAAFTINDFKGKVVLVETLAMWCSNCLKQQKQVLALHDLIGERDDFISLGLDIDPKENASGLAAYTSKNGFDWIYAVATPEVYREIAELYGPQFVNPPSTPVLIIDRHGVAHPLPFGIKSAEDLYQALLPLLNEGM